MCKSGLNHKRGAQAAVEVDSTHISSVESIHSEKLKPVFRENLLGERTPIGL